MRRHATALSRLFRALDLVGHGLGPVLDLAIRWWLAAIFWVSGILKATNWATALELARNEYPVPWMDPVAAAWTGAAIELVCPVFLFLGLATRLAAAPMLALSLVIQAYYRDLPDHLFWAMLLGWLIVRGPGALSLDRLIAPAIRRTALPLVEPASDLVAAMTRYGAPAYQLFLRLWMAEIFWSSGLTKIASWSTTVALFREEYQVPVLPPELAAVFATSVELACPVLLTLGLGTRLAALPLIAITLVIQFTYLDRAEHFYWLMLLGLLALHGPGPLSIDALIRRWATRLVPGLDGALPPGSDTWPRVVIVGAGFGGLEAARALRYSPVRVTVVDRRNHHLFQPLLYQVATAALSPADIATPIREILRDHANARVLLGRVTGADTEARTVRVEREGMAPRDIPYDFLVLATGA
ncbi:MAG: DoxX family membrane protein, partial [Rhodospirillales bacterium]|nr:DoxX family membrane protein [Rhodospirillales bacterium]